MSKSNQYFFIPYPPLLKYFFTPCHPLFHALCGGEGWGEEVAFNIALKPNAIFKSPPLPAP
jgi:hypothetical protein